MMATATVTRSLMRAIPRGSTTTTSTILSATRSSRQAAAKQFFQNTSRRSYSSTAIRPKSNTAKYFGITAGAALFGGSIYYLTAQQGYAPTLNIQLKQGSCDQSPGIFNPTPSDYQKVYNAIAALLWEKDDYDDGSYGPVLLRLAWHCSGTYDAETNTGGSNGATMRFLPESAHGANTGLQNARDFLEPVKQQFPWISYGDLWTLGGVCAVQEMQGPSIPWRPGRQDKDVAFCTPDGRLPDGARGQDHIRAIFGRMGFNDQEMVALSGAHAVGRCHTDRSGFEGPWTFSPTVFTNDFFRLLMEEKWGWRKWNGPKQYEDSTSKSLMMLPSDMALIKDEEFKKHVERYAKDSQVFFNEFSDAVCKLFELGVPFKEGSERLRFVSNADQEA